MDIMERIAMHYTSLTKKEIETCEKIVNDPSIIIQHPVNDAATIYQVSPSSIVRFSKKVGYKGYTDLRYDLEKQFNHSDETKKNSNSHTALQAITESNIKAFESLKLLDYEEGLSDFIAALYSKPIIISIGVGNSYFPASQFAYSLAMEKCFVETIGDTIRLEHLMRTDFSKAVVIIFTVSGHESLYGQLVKQVKKKQGKVAIITTNKESKLLDYADYTFILPVAPMIGGSTLEKNAYVDSRTILFAFAGIISYYYGRQYNNKSASF